MKEYRTYLIVWASLVVLTGLTMGVSYLRLGVGNAIVALAIASAKAALVGLYFMHLRRESALVRAFALAPLLFLALIIFGTLSDTLFRK
ncbi:MAG TPA: cytochrome C oxidase subunit IV family protein [Candidatus Deferrimicrobiaceae bacterium]|jgi:cytochrome c oxidase subunit 4